MDAIEKIIEKIDAQALAERAELEQTTRAEITADFQSQKSQVETAHEAQLEKQQQVLRSKYKQLTNRQQIEIRQETLVDRQQYLNKLFAEALQKMEAWDVQTTQKFAKRCLQALKLENEVTFITTPALAEKGLSKDWLAKLSEDLSYPVKHQVAPELTSDGFIVDDNGVQYNFIYKDLLNEVRTKESNAITQKLFD
ncbi:MAG: hypothetical protein ACK5MW_06930 [Enterococcus sp.]